MNSPRISSSAFKQPADDGGEEGGGMTGGAVSDFWAVGARDRIWAEVGPVDGVTRPAMEEEDSGFLVVLSVLLLAVFVLISVALFLHAELCRKIFCYLPRLGTYYLCKPS